MIHASLVQMDVIPLAAAENFSRIREFITAEADRGAQLIVFPELANTGYVEPLVPGGTFVSKVPHYGQALVAACANPAGDEIESLVSLCRERGVSVIVGLGMRDRVMPAVIRNSALLITPSGIVGTYTKVHQWHNEKLYFTRGEVIDSFDAVGTRVGMQICYDSRFPEVTRILAEKGASIVVSSWASFGPADKPVADEELFVHRGYARAVENGIFFLSCNRAGLHGDFRFWGRSCVIAPDGKVIGRLDHDREDVLRVQIDLDEVTRYRSRVGVWADYAPEIYASARAGK